MMNSQASVFRKFLFVVSSVAALVTVGAAGASALSDAAGRLQPGESMVLPTTIPSTLLTAEGNSIIMWGSSAVWDPVHHQMRYIGKRDSNSFPFHGIYYDEGTNSWGEFTLHPELAAPTYGHGYDLNTVDPATGDHYMRSYGENKVYRRSGATWSVIPFPQGMINLGGLSWVPRLGLVWADSANFKYYDGARWNDINGNVAGGVAEYHTVSEYNPITNVLLMGAGNGGNALWKYDVAANRVSQIATPPFNVGAADGQGILVSDDSSAAFIGWQKGSANWAAYSVSENRWVALGQSSGDGSAPQRGTPNLHTGNNFVVATPISTYGVIMFLQIRSSSSAGDKAWIYKHSDSIAQPTPQAPVSLTAR